MKNKIMIATCILLIFLAGIWDKYVLFNINSALQHFFFGSSVGFVKQFADLLIEKIPAFTENTAYFVWAFFHSLLGVLCLKIYFKWSFKTFLLVFFACFSVFLLISTVIIFGFVFYKGIFFRFWHQFKELFFSPFPLIFMFLICKLLRKTNT